MLRDIEIYLPKYLSSGELTGLFAELKGFPDNIDSRLYSSYRDNERVLFQGDGIAYLPVVTLPSNAVAIAFVMVMSNTCDIAPGNRRWLPANITYCPLIRFAAYRQELLSAFPESHQQIEDHLETIKLQQCSSMFYLPYVPKLQDERIALMDKAVHHRVDRLNIDELVENRLFTLSNYGFYLFLFKLSVHFTRLREGVDRNSA